MLQKTVQKDARSSSLRNSFSYITLGALVVAAFVSGLYIGARENRFIEQTVFSGGHTPPEGVDLEPLWKAWQLLGERHVPASSTSQVANEDLVYGAIGGLTGALGDPYTIFLPPVEAGIFTEDISGNFQGVGMEVGIRNGSLVVIAPLKGMPAEAAGVQSGDRILEIDGDNTEGMTVDEAVQRIRGEEGTSVTLTLAREGEGEFVVISIVRATIEIPTIDTDLLDDPEVVNDEVFVIRLFNFSAISPGLFRGALREFILADTDKLILDLRGNPGGFLEASVDIASWFLPTGTVVVTEDLGENEKPRIHRSRGYSAFDERLKMVVLIDQGSASASEILAGALSEHGAATLVGVQTFGKGSVQELVDVTGGSTLKITIARWLTPQGRSLSNGGLEPDIEVLVTAEDIESGLDLQFEKALEFLRSL